MALLRTTRWTSKSDRTNRKCNSHSPLNRLRMFACIGAMLTVALWIGPAEYGAMGSAIASSTAKSGQGSAVASSVATASDGHPKAPPYPFAGRPNYMRHGHKDKRLNWLYNELSRLESRTFDSLDECQQWAELHSQYIDESGAYRHRRPNEVAKQEECDALYAADDNNIFNRLYNFRTGVVSEGDKLDMASSLIADYVDVREAAATNQEVADELDALRREDPQFESAMDRLEANIQYIDTMVDQVRGGPVLAAFSGRVATLLPPNADHADQVEAQIRDLVGRDALSEQDRDHLLKLSETLDRYLTDGSVDSTSGRWRLLLGAVEAARAVVMRKPAEVLEEPSRGGGASAVSMAAAGSGKGAAVASASAKSSAPPQRTYYEPRGATSEAQAQAAVTAGRNAASVARASSNSKRGSAVSAAMAQASGGFHPTMPEAAHLHPPPPPTPKSAIAAAAAADGTHAFQHPSQPRHPAPRRRAPGTSAYASATAKTR